MRLIWQHWCLESAKAGEQCPPLRFLEPEDMGDDEVPAQKNERRRLADLRSIMSKMEQVRAVSCMRTC
jgi:hypothetical protein